MIKLTGVKFYRCKEDRRIYICFVKGYRSNDSETYYHYDRCKHYGTQQPWGCDLAKEIVFNKDDNELV